MCSRVVSLSVPFFLFYKSVTKQGTLLLVLNASVFAIKSEQKEVFRNLRDSLYVLRPQEMLQQYFHQKKVKSGKAVKKIAKLWIREKKVSKINYNVTKQKK